LSGNVNGMLLMLIASIVLTIMHALVRHIGSDMHPFEVSFFRNLFGLIAVMPLVLRSGIKSLYTRHPGLQLLRAVLGVSAMLSWFYALSIVPIAQATALSFTAVIFASVGAAVVLREKMHVRRWTAVCLGFVGAFFILRPGFQEVSFGMMLVLGSSVAWGMAVVVVKRLSRTDPVVSIVAWMAISLTVFSFVPALYVWTWPSFEELLLLSLVGALGTTGHLAMTNALKHAEATTITPLDFTRLLWASVIGYFVFGEIPDIWTWIGGGIIIASASYLIFREARVGRVSNKY